MLCDATVRFAFLHPTIIKHLPPLLSQISSYSSAVNSLLPSYRGIWRDWVSATDHVDDVEKVMLKEFANMGRPWSMPWADASDFMVTDMTGFAMVCCQIDRSQVQN